MLIIDNEFKNLIPPLTKEEYQQLEKNIIDAGEAWESIKTWNGIIVDGHNRYEICTRLNLPFTTSEKVFDDRNQVLNWIIDNQLGRHNLAPWQMSILRGKRYNAEKQDKYSHPKSGDQFDHRKTSEKLSEQYGVSAPTIRRDGNFAIAAEKASELEDVPVMQLTKEQILQVAREINREKQSSRRKNQIAETPTIPDGKYNVIYADPPWKYTFGFDIHGAADRHYKTLSPQEIADLPVQSLFEDNAVLFMWATSPKLEDAFTVINGWGFEYKTSFIWDKVKHNMGHYNSVRHEFLLICTKGSFPKQSDTLIDSVVSIERSDEHSEKPEEFRKIIEDMYPLSKKIELFSRKKDIPGWKTWGNEL